jgi:uncharacterized protein YkwD
MLAFSGGRTMLRVAVAMFVAALVLTALAPARAEAEERFGRRRQMLALTNEDRTQHHRRALNFAAAISQYAKDHSQAMARRGHLFHSTGQQLSGVLQGHTWSIAGENVGVGGSLESLQDAFMASRLHRENILRPEFDRAAVGVVREDGRLWVTVIFYG